jgi:hypothetical protein
MKTCFSKRGLPYDNALRQMRAIIISEKGLSIPASKRTSRKSSKKVSKSKKNDVNSYKTAVQKASKEKYTTTEMN